MFSDSSGFYSYRLVDLIRVGRLALGVAGPSGMLLILRDIDTPGRFGTHVLKDILTHLKDIDSQDKVHTIP